MLALGYAPTTTRQGDEVRIGAKNSMGYKFTVILTAVKTKDSEQTKARIEWEGGRDDQTGMMILARLQPTSK